MYSKGLSYPQVVEALETKVTDKVLLESLAEKARNDAWNKIFTIVQEKTAAGATFGQITEEVAFMEEDPQIIDFICNTWYAVQTEYMENMVESPGHISEGIKGVVISSLMLFISFWAGWSILPKIVWSIIGLLSLYIWVYGIYQKSLAKQLDDIIKRDYSKYQEF